MDFVRIRYKGDVDYYISAAQTLRIRKVVSLAGHGNVVLDVGTYDGALSKLVAMRGNIVHGLDASLEAAKLARVKLIPVVNADVEEGLPFQSSCCDVVIAAEVIEHVLDTDFFVEETRRVLRPWGTLILTTPNAASLGRRMYLFLGKNPHFEASFSWPRTPAPAGHIRFFTKDLLLSFLQYHGFRIQFFGSNAVNFTSSGSVYSRLLATIWPSLGASLIVAARKL